MDAALSYGGQVGAVGDAAEAVRLVIVIGLIVIAAMGVACGVTAARGPGAAVGEGWIAVCGWMRRLGVVFVPGSYDGCGGPWEMTSIVVWLVARWCRMWAAAEDLASCICCCATWAAVGIAAGVWLAPGGGLNWWGVPLAGSATLAVTTRLWGCVERRRTRREDEAGERMARAGRRAGVGGHWQAKGARAPAGAAGVCKGCAGGAAAGACATCGAALESDRECPCARGRPAAKAGETTAAR